MNKKELRKHVRRLLRNTDLTIYTQPALRRIANNPVFQGAAEVLAYVPDGIYEIPFMQRLFEASQNTQWFFPAIGDGNLTFYPVENWSRLVPGVFGLYEPAARQHAWSPHHKRAACILVPALAVTGDGVRLGRGGGYYDRFLQSLANYSHVRTVSIVPPEALMAALPTESHDIAIDTVLVANSKERWSR